MFIRSYNSIIYREIVFLSRGALLAECEKRIEIMEKEILYYAGTKRVLARRKYLRLIKACSKKCGLDDPIYLKRR